MPELIFLFSNPASVEPPIGILGWSSWLFLLITVLVLLWRWRNYNQSWTATRRWIFLILFLLVPVTTLLVPGFQLSSVGSLPIPGVPQEPPSPVLSVFAALPWMLAAGWLGPNAAVLLALSSGLLQAVWSTHNLFSPLGMAFLAALFATAIHQRYRTNFYRLLRHPSISALILGLVDAGLFLFSSINLTQVSLATRLDYALTSLGPVASSQAIALLLSGLFAEIIAIAIPQWWGNKEKLTPSPAESSIAARFLYGMIPLTVILSLTLILADWIVAGNSVRQMVRSNMVIAATKASEYAPVLTDSGKALLLLLSSDQRLYASEQGELNQLLDQLINTLPFFYQLIYLDTQGVPVAFSPVGELDEPVLTPEEQDAVVLALKGVQHQDFPSPPVEGSLIADFSFLGEVSDPSGKPHGYLIGRSNFNDNPYASSLLITLVSMKDFQGESILIDGDGLILYHTNPDLVMERYVGRVPDEAGFYDEIASDGTRQFAYFQRVRGSSWSVIMTVPAHYAQQQALSIAKPLLGVIVILSLLAIVVIRLGLRTLTASLHTLAIESNRIAQGQLDHPLRVDGEDEIGQLRRAFEQMRAGLKYRMEELNRLLVVSQGVASSLELETALQPVLDAALTTGASSARVVLAPAMVPELDGDSRLPTYFASGSSSNLYAGLDDQILSLTRQQDRVLLSNLARPRLLTFPPGHARPQALLAIALRHENLHYGSLWVAFDVSHSFTNEEIRFLATLASQAALATANARLFMNAEVGRQRLEAILASTPDPVIVTDQRNRLLLANPAAWHVFGMGIESGRGQPIERVLSQERLIDLLRSPGNDKQSVELLLPNGRAYLAMASSIMADDRRVGRLCVLQDVTHFKELDNLKSEFVSTVSHDLRSPLTLIRGYATMLQMVGELNEQQTGYVRKIISGVENMSKLVNSLLDLGRIEAGIGLQLELLPVQDVIERVIGAFQLQAAQRRIQLTLETRPESPPLIEADQALLQQAIHNLVENAIKYTDPDGKVQVSYQLDRDFLIFQVRDTGIGISPADQQHLFEKFFQVGRKGTPREGGSGLGLAIVKSIAERHNGRVWVESQLGKGSVFYLAIPVRTRSKSVTLTQGTA